MRTKKWKKTLGTKVAAAIAATILACSMGVTSANASDTDWLRGNLDCGWMPLIGTESNAKGKVDHALAAFGGNQVVQRVYVGTSTVYAPWGYSFVRSSAGIFYVFADSTYGAIKPGTLKRFCTTW